MRTNVSRSICLLILKLKPGTFLKENLRFSNLWLDRNYETKIWFHGVMKNII